VSVAIRPATADDHAAFARLVPELGVDDPIPAAGVFAREIAPSTLIAADPATGAVLGYAYRERSGAAVHVKHLVVAPDARRAGVGRALLGAIAEDARSRGAVTWSLNVKPDNVAAIRLYESVGLARAYASRAVWVPWAALDALPSRDLHVRAITPEDDARIESSLRITAGQLATARAKPGRVLLVAEEIERSEVVGAAVFDPAFPGAHPFRARTLGDATVLLRAMRAHARPGPSVSVLFEDQPELADAFLALGAVVRLDMLHMRGPIPPG
jgi:GNAT superfamily N-acetyltransferase